MTVQSVSSSSLSSETSPQPYLQPISSEQSSADAEEATSSAVSHAAVIPVPEVSDYFPPFERAVFPVSRVPNWGIMDTEEEWRRTFSEMTNEDFVPVPRYDMDTLMTPMESLLVRRAESVPAITTKLFYSTRHFAAYDLDAGEFSAVHPGVDLKLALGTPIGAIGGGRVHAVRSDARGLGLHIIIEHRIRGDTYFSIYGHFGSVHVQEGDTVRPGTIVGRVGITGNTTAPHLHLQVDRGEPDELAHQPYWPSSLPGRTEASHFTVHPLQFIAGAWAEPMTAGRDEPRDTP